MPIYTALNLPFTAQFSDFPVWNMIDTYLAAADLPCAPRLILPEIDLDAEMAGIRAARL